MQILWARKILPQLKQLNKFVSIWKYCVIGALQWLVINHPLYENIQINHYLLKIRKDKFILSGIIDSIVHYNANQHQCKNYITDLNNGNFENNFDAIIIGTSIKRDYINSSCIYSDFDDQRQNPTLQLLSVVANIKLIVSTID